MKNKIEIDVPEGFEFVGIRELQKGDWYLDEYYFSKPIQQTNSMGSRSDALYIILKKSQPKRRVFEEINRNNVYPNSILYFESGDGKMLVESSSSYKPYSYSGITYREVTDEF